MAKSRLKHAFLCFSHSHPLIWLTMVVFWPRLLLPIQHFHAIFLMTRDFFPLFDAVGSCITSILSFSHSSNVFQMKGMKIVSAYSLENYTRGKRKMISFFNIIVVNLLLLLLTGRILCCMIYFMTDILGEGK